MKKLMVTAAILVSSVCFSFAQDRMANDNRERKTPEERAQLMTNGLEKKLTLSADQKAKVYKINLERAKKVDEFQNARTDDRKKQMEAQRSLMEDSNKKLSEVLNADQKKIYDELKSERKEKMKEHNGGRKNRNGRNHRENSFN